MSGLPSGTSGLSSRLSSRLPSGFSRTLPNGLSSRVSGLTSGFGFLDLAWLPSQQISLHHVYRHTLLIGAGVLSPFLETASLLSALGVIDDVRAGASSMAISD